MAELTHFDPDAPGQTGSGIFGLPFSVAESEIVIVPVPWEVTVSYRAGTAGGPAAVLQASPQLDFFDEKWGEAWKRGIAMAEASDQVAALNRLMRPLGEQLIGFQEAGGQLAESPVMQGILSDVNEACGRMCSLVQQQTAALLQAGKRVILLGGDHSTPLGYLAALASHYPDFGILQIDAHMDLRPAYEGFTWSHASIMYNALQLPQISSLVQVGVRDYSRAEYALATSDTRITAYTGRKLTEWQCIGKPWQDTCAEIVSKLPQQVYVSFDIDGLDPTLCPHTGTPVPGGLDFGQASFLLEAVLRSGREIVGADLVEVAPGPDGDEWDGNVGARMLYKLCELVGREDE